MKGAVVQIDAAPFRQWYQQHYGVEVGLKKGVSTKKEGEAAIAAQSTHVKRKLAARVTNGKPLDPVLDEQFSTGRLYAQVTSRPGQCGRVDGYILEGKELAFYAKKVRFDAASRRRAAKCTLATAELTHRRFTCR